MLNDCNADNFFEFEDAKEVFTDPLKLLLI